MTSSFIWTYELFIQQRAGMALHHARSLAQKARFALLDVDDKKDKFEIVHAHFMEIPRFDKMREKAKKKD